MIICCSRRKQTHSLFYLFFFLLPFSPYIMPHKVLAVRSRCLSPPATLQAPRGKMGVRCSVQAPRPALGMQQVPRSPQPSICCSRPSSLPSSPSAQVSRPSRLNQSRGSAPSGPLPGEAASPSPELRQHAPSVPFAPARSQGRHVPRAQTEIMIGLVPDPASPRIRREAPAVGKSVS